MFSIPINPKLTEKQFYQFIDFCLKYKPYIYDLYFTCRMPPFVQDAMGDVFVTDPYATIEAALEIQERTGIPISATFNNTLVKPTQHNLDLFLTNFEQLYLSGIKSATIPHTHWVATKQIQSKFPELLIKNTILRNVSRSNEVAELAKAGFHYINLDRDLMRDRDALIECKRAAKKYNVKLSLLANEGCIGNCSMMDEHFQYNNSRATEPQYFNDPISRVSCPKWDYEDPSTPLKTANFPPWKEDWDELLEFVDVIKMHGRESIGRMYETMDIISRYASNQEILFDTFDEYLNETNLKDKPINAWRKIIKNCKFNCWDCNFCDKVYEAKSAETSHPLVLAVTHELVSSVNLKNTYEVAGLTAPRVQKFLTGISKHCSKYLEIGSAMGATASAISNNCTMYCVDNWSQNIQPESDDFILPLNTKEEFIKNVSNNVVLFDEDMFTVDVSKIKDIDLFFYDGPHEEYITEAAITYYKTCFADHCIMIFDDANWEGVVKGAQKGIAAAGFSILYSKLMLNSVENKNMWWNGLYITVVKRESI